MTDYRDLILRVRDSRLTRRKDHLPMTTALITGPLLTVLLVVLAGVAIRLALDVLAPYEDELS